MPARVPVEKECDTYLLLAARTRDAHFLYDKYKYAVMINIISFNLILFQFIGFSSLNN